MNNRIHIPSHKKNEFLKYIFEHMDNYTMIEYTITSLYFLFSVCYLYNKQKFTFLESTFIISFPYVSLLFLANRGTYNQTIKPVVYNLISDIPIYINNSILEDACNKCGI